MTADEALNFIDELVLAKTGRGLNDLQRAIFRGSWQGKSYKEIRNSVPTDYQLDYIMRDVGPKLWEALSQVLGETVTKKSIEGPVKRAKQKFDSERMPFEHSASPQVQTIASDWQLLDSELQPDLEINGFWSNSNSSKQDWGTAPDVSQFYGRRQDLDELDLRIQTSRCPLITVFGVVGIGKTALSVKLAERVRERYQFLIWRSFDHRQIFKQPPKLPELVSDLVQVLSNQQETSTDPSRLLYYLVHHSCLIVLDGVESILCGGVHDGSYVPEYEGYRDFFLQIGRTVHQSCLVLTSREKPKEAAILESASYVFSLKLKGLGELAGRELFGQKGISSPIESDWRMLIQHYEGNPCALNIVATTVQDVFSGNITDFLEQLKQECGISADIRTLLDQQFGRLSELERTVIRSLTKKAEPATFADISNSVAPSLSRIQLQEVLQSLMRRSLVEVSTARYSLQPLIAEYVTSYL